MGGETHENTSTQTLSHTHDCPFADVRYDPYDESDGPGKHSASWQSDNAISHREAW